jgi:competence protein ComEC
MRLQDQTWIFPFCLFFILLFIISFFISSVVRFYILLGLFFLTGVILVLNTARQSDLLNLANNREYVTIEGIVLEPTRMDAGIGRLKVMVECLFKDQQSVPIREKIYVSVYQHAMEFYPGDRIRFPARLRSFRNFNNPGRYNYESAMFIQGLSCGASVSDGRRIVPMGKGSLGLPLQTIEIIRRPIRILISETQSMHNQAILRALILGERQLINPDIREPFNISGLGHILAVSGLHIGLIAWLSFGFFKWLLSRSHYLILKTDIRKIAAITACIPVVAYTCLAGFQVSSQRAMIMVLVYLFSVIWGREKEIWSTLALAALVVLAIDPLALFTISFQLSFLAVTGILWLAPAIHSNIPNPFMQMRQKNIWARLYFYITGLIVVTLSAVLFLLPITAFYFHRIPMDSIPANLTTLPILGFWIIPFGLLSALFSHISSPVAHVFLQTASWGLDCMMVIILFWAHFSWASALVVTPNIFEIVLFYGLIFFLFFYSHQQWAKVGLYLVLIVLFADIFIWIYKTQFNPHLKVSYFDVGQGNAALIQFPGDQRMLIDGGGFHQGSFDTGEMIVAPALWHEKIKRIDYIVLSHPQSDHMNGLRFIVSHFKPKEFWYNGDYVETPSFKELLRILDQKNIDKVLPAELSAGREIAGAQVKVLHPISKKQDMGSCYKSGSYYKSGDLNNRSLVLKVSYRGKSILFPGDLEFSGEETVITIAGPNLRSDILLVPHHGSKGSCSKSFLQIVHPKVCIISSGKGNAFGFPHHATMERLKEFGCKIFRIDEEGAIQISITEQGWEISTFLKDEGILSRCFR